MKRITKMGPKPTCTQNLRLQNPNPTLKTHRVDHIFNPETGLLNLDSFYDVRPWILHESEAFICKALKGRGCPAYGGNAEPLIIKAL